MFKATGCNFSTGCELTSYEFWLSFIQIRNIRFCCSQRILYWLRISRFAFAYGYFWNSNSFVSKTMVWNSSIKVSVPIGQFYLCINLPDKYLFSKYAPYNRNIMGWNLQKCDLLWLFSVVKLIFSTCWFSSIKVSQDSFKFSKGDLEKYFWLRIHFGALITR